MQLDNQLPLTVMPVLLAPEQTPDMHHPVLKMTLTIRNEDLDGLQIYPYVYIRVMSSNIIQFEHLTGHLQEEYNSQFMLLIFYYYGR